MNDGSITHRSGLIQVEDDVVRLARDLIRIDTSNPTADERKAAEYVAAELSSLGLEPTIVEAEPGRASVIARWAGTDPDADALSVHHHLDVVPANPADWTLPPFAAEVQDGCIWGRGAVDMKGNVAATLAAVRSMYLDGQRPRRDVVLAFSADEEAGGHKGSNTSCRPPARCSTGSPRQLARSADSAWTCRTAAASTRFKSPKRDKLGCN